MREHSQHPTKVRHLVLWLTVIAYMITYMDRSIIAAAESEIREEYGFDLITMGLIFSAFRWSYALCQVPGGWLGDRIGPRRALSLIVTWWSVFTSATGLAWNAASMVVLRVLFGVGEAGAFPIATRSLSRWMLATERGFAQGITHAGSRLGQAFTPLLVALLIGRWGWRAAFVIFGGVGLVWAVVWFVWYRDSPDEHAWVNQAERQLIRDSVGAARPTTAGDVPWRRILSSRTLWVLSLMYGLYVYCLATYQDWLPGYLREHWGMSLQEMGFYASLPLLAGTLGDLLGGWASDIVARRTGNLAFARRAVASSGFVLASVGVFLGASASDAATCIAFTCLGVFCLELTVGVSWAIPLDIGGDYAGSVAAVMNTCGNTGGAISPLMLAFLQHRYGWDVPFLVVAVFCLIAAGLFTRIDATRRIFG